MIPENHQKKEGNKYAYRVGTDEELRKYAG